MSHVIMSSTLRGIVIPTNAYVVYAVKANGVWSVHFVMGV